MPSKRPQINVRLSHEEHDVVRAASESHGCTPTEFGRKAILLLAGVRKGETLVAEFEPEPPVDVVPVNGDGVQRDTGRPLIERDTGRKMQQRDTGRRRPQEGERDTGRGLQVMGVQRCRCPGKRDLTSYGLCRRCGRVA